MRKIIVVILIMAGTSLKAQSEKLYALTYKFKENESYRISFSAYFNIASGGKSATSYGEASFDLYQTVDEADGEFADLRVRANLSRCIQNGRNLTYQLARAYEGQTYFLSIDRFGKLYGDSIFAESSETPGYVAVHSDMSHAMPPLPTYPVKIGDTWDWREQATSEQVESMLNMTELEVTQSKAVGKFVLSEVQNGIAKIRLDAEISGSASVDSMPPMDFLMRITGDYVLDLGMGLLSSGNVNLELAAATTINAKEITFRGTRTLNFLTEKIK